MSQTVFGCVVTGLLRDGYDRDRAEFRRRWPNGLDSSRPDFWEGMAAIDAEQDVLLLAQPWAGLVHHVYHDRDRDLLIVGNPVDRIRPETRTALAAIGGQEWVIPAV